MRLEDGRPPSANGESPGEAGLGGMQVDEIRVYLPDDPGQANRLDRASPTGRAARRPGVMLSLAQLHICDEVAAWGTGDCNPPAAIGLVGDEVEHRARDALLGRLRRVQDGGVRPPRTVLYR